MKCAIIRLLAAGKSCGGKAGQSCQKMSDVIVRTLAVESVRLDKADSRQMRWHATVNPSFSRNLLGLTSLNLFVLLLQTSLALLGNGVLVAV